MDERSKARWTLLLFVGSIFLIVLSVAILFPTKKNSHDEITTHQGDIWAERDDEVIEIVKRCKIPDTEGNILQLTAGYLEVTKTQGNFIEFKGWYAFQVKDSLYEAGVGYKINGLTKTAKWDIDLSKRKINPRNQQAFIFSGNNDILNF